MRSEAVLKPFRGWKRRRLLLLESLRIDSHRQENLRIRKPGGLGITTHLQNCSLDGDDRYAYHVPASLLVGKLNGNFQSSMISFVPRVIQIEGDLQSDGGESPKLEREPFLYYHCLRWLLSDHQRGALKPGQLNGPQRRSRSSVSTPSNPARGPTQLLQTFSRSCFLDQASS